MRMAKSGEQGTQLGTTPAANLNFNGAVILWVSPPTAQINVLALKFVICTQEESHLYICA